MVTVRGDTPLEVIVIVDVPGAGEGVGAGEGEGDGVAEVGVEFPPPHPIPITRNAAMHSDNAAVLICAKAVDRSIIFRRTFLKY
jgi:hypothetical protein